MDALLPWLPWIVGALVALLIVRFVVGLALRLLSFAALLVVVYLAWQWLSGAVS